ncbi:BadF/BadG/BcrA/BcrD ATPase family protein [Micromonospora sp. WMMD987]|uniref:N-acetylglucosamine kinase n=1 Tax=Micromonospora TaxID=1873 RepID=UPI00249CA64A|nr:BadF/BadG/BcrA/BcrD ATPase family protein [Micromonospora sp. WMMD987]WFE93210.1 BadF/BadG/BcrA/BcrD ATPase family protein [Micromonospora sp. WMMD987]
MNGAEPVRVGVDLGQGGCRAVARHGRSTGHAETPGYWTGDADTRIADAVAGALADLGPPDPDTTVLVGVGMTGLNGRPPATDALQARLRALGRPGRLRVADDSVTAYLGALGPVPGAVVAAGTGAVVLAADAAGRTARSDGWGADLGDRGSGHWIGRTAIRTALRDRDRAAPGRLADAVTDAWGPVETLPARWRADPPTPERIAGFATTVADLARAGDDDAARIWRRAGELLAESVVGALFRVGLEATPVPVAGTGGLFRATDLLWSPFTTALRAAAPTAQPVPAAGDPLAGALALADGPPGTGPFPGLTVQIDFDAKAEHR